MWGTPASATLRRWPPTRSASAPLASPPWGPTISGRARFPTWSLCGGNRRRRPKHAVLLLSHSLVHRGRAADGGVSAGAAATIPTFAGLKFTHENLAEYAHCVAYGNGRYEIFFGRDEMLLGALAMGASSGVGTTYNFSAPIFQRVYEAFTRGDLDEARHWQGLAIAMIEIAVAHGGMPAFKAMMRWFGVDCGPCRLPAGDPG